MTSSDKDASLDLYTAATPNGHKVSIALEELGLPYRTHVIDLRSGGQFTPEFLKISPNNKIPAIVDGDLSIFESGAILVYLAEKTGRLLPTSGQGRYKVLEWLFFQVGGIGPMLGQVHHFRNYAPEKLPYAIDRYTNEAKRLFHVVDKRLSDNQFLAGHDYSIADIANMPWMRLHKNQGIEITEYPHVARWIDALEARPAVKKGLATPPRTDVPMDDKAKETLFGKSQYERR
jgi:GST-like protein